MVQAQITVQETWGVEPSETDLQGNKEFQRYVRTGFPPGFSEDNPNTSAQARILRLGYEGIHVNSGDDVFDVAYDIHNQAFLPHDPFDPNLIKKGPGAVPLTPATLSTEGFKTHNMTLSNLAYWDFIVPPMLLNPDSFYFTPPPNMALFGRGFLALFLIPMAVFRAVYGPMLGVRNETFGLPYSFVRRMQYLSLIHI